MLEHLTQGCCLVDVFQRQTKQWEPRSEQSLTFMPWASWLASNSNQCQVSDLWGVCLCPRWSICDIKFSFKSVQMSVIWVGNDISVFTNIHNTVFHCTRWNLQAKWSNDFWWHISHALLHPDFSSLFQAWSLSVSELPSPSRVAPSTRDLLNV